MTTVYFVRHAEPNYSNHNDRERELTEKGLEDRKLVTAYLSDQKIGAVLSSPYKRALDTIQPFADQIQLPIELVEDFRERAVDSVWIEDFNSFCKQQWADFSYKLSDGESLGDVQRRAVRALFEALERHPNGNLAIGGHGTAISTIIHYFDSSFGYQEFEAIKNCMPWIVKIIFDRGVYQSMEFVDLLS